MTQIDRYVLFLYGRVFVVCFMTLSGLLVVIQLFTNVDEFITFGQARGGFAKGLFEYFGPQIISLFDRMCGLIALLATMFVFAWLSRTNELTAILAAGISKGRIIRPLLIASIGVVLVASILRETMIPRFSAILSKSPKELTGDAVEPLRPVEDHDQGVLIVGRNVIPAKRLIDKPAFKFNGPAAQWTRQIVGENAEYLEADRDHPAGYLVRGVSAFAELADKNSARTSEGTYLLLPKDNPWIPPGCCFIPSKIEFDMLSGGNSRQYASTFELIWLAKNQSHYYGADLKVSIHSRFIQPLLDLTQLLIGLPLILSNRNRNLVSMIMSCVVSYGLFFGISIGLRTLGSNATLLTPAAAAWAPLLIFAPIAWTRSIQAMDS
jgi:lipopolysaccharide export system permease protein